MQHENTTTKNILGNVLLIKPIYVEAHMRIIERGW
jgi:hypothetical protein